MKTVLLLNHEKVKCGTYQFLYRINSVINRSRKIKFIYKEASNRNDYLSILNNVNPDFEIVNWHWDRTPWYTENEVISNPRIGHYFIYHDGSMIRNYDKYLFFGAFDPNSKDVPENKRVLLPRPLCNYSGDYPINSIPTIGSFGFAFNHKKFHTIAPFVGKYFSKAVVNLHFTNPFFGDTPGNKIQDIISLCHRFNTNPGIRLNITTSFMDDNGVLKFLAGNDINLFMYDVSQQNPGISSATDYALSVRRPIAISNNMMFRHIRSDEILVEKSPLNEILSRGTSPLERFYSEWSTDRLISEMENLFI